MQSPAPSEYFQGIKFNYSFYTTKDSNVTIEYVNNNFLRCTGYSYSRSISTTFNGIIYALGGINTTNITATGTISATNIGIGVTNPTTSSFEILKNVTTSSDLINMRYDTTNGLRYQQAYVAANDIKYNVIQKNNNVDTNMMTF